MSSIVCHLKTGQFPCSDKNRQVNLPMSQKQDDRLILPWSRIWKFWTLYNDLSEELAFLKNFCYPAAAAAAAKSPQLCPTLCKPIDGSPPGSAVPGILQARILEWVAITFSRGSSQPRDQIQVSSIAGGFFTS